LATYDGLTVDPIVAAGDPSSAILATADEIEADLIVLGPHRRQLRDIFVGTTVQRTVARSTRPVLMAAGVPSRYARAVVAFDLEEDSRQVAKRIADLDMLRASEIIAIHAFDAPARGMMQLAMTGGVAMDDYARGEAIRASAEFRAFLGGAGLKAARHMALPLNGTAARTIRECAAEEKAGLVVVGTSQRKGIERFLLGSVAEAVLGASDRDVLVVPASSMRVDA
jgi:nucleotide-binding universal stress UspA family protein